MNANCFNVTIDQETFTYDRDDGTKMNKKEIVEREKPLQSVSFENGALVQFVAVDI